MNDIIYHYRVQLMPKNEHFTIEPSKEQIKEQVSALKSFCKLFNLKYAKHEYRCDMYYIAIPQVNYEFALLTNALECFCFFHNSVFRLGSDKTTYSFEQFWKLLAKGHYDEK